MFLRNFSWKTTLKMQFWTYYFHSRFSTFNSCHGSSKVLLKPTIVDKYWAKTYYADIIFTIVGHNYRVVEIIFFCAMFPLFLQLPEKKCPRPKWTIYKHVSDNSKKCLSFGNTGILSFVTVVCRRHLSSSSVIVVVDDKKSCPMNVS